MQTKWEDFYKSHDYFHLDPHEFLPGFASKCEAKGFDRVLDLGCGAGQDILYLAERGFLVTGVDFSPAAATNAEDLLQTKGLPGKVYVDNLFDKVTSFEPEEFPAVIAINSLEYTDIDTFVATISEVSRILSEKGLFLLIVSSKKSEVNLKVNEQIFFDEDQITEIVRKRFNILDFGRDGREDFGIFLEKK